MLRYGRDAIFEWSNKRRLPWLLLAVALMCASAYSIARSFAAVGFISARPPGSEAELPRIAAQAERWQLVGIALPFFAALLLGFGKTSSPSSGGPQASLTYSDESRVERWTAPFVRYLVRLAVSVAGTLAFIFSLLLIGFVLAKLGVHSG